MSHPPLSYKSALEVTSPAGFHGRLCVAERRNSNFNVNSFHEKKAECPFEVRFGIRPKVGSLDAKTGATYLHLYRPLHYALVHTGVDVYAASEIQNFDYS